MKLSRSIAYGIHACIQLARLHGRPPTPSSHIAREGHLPERFLVQILRCLVTKGVLKSTCGASGGYSLARPPAQITLRDIVESFDNSLDGCRADLDCLSRAARSQVARILEEASEAARTKLQQLTLSDLLSAETHKSEPIPNTPPPLGIKRHLVDSNEYETPAGDSPATR
jgi:Rrf2 family protein